VIAGVRDKAADAERAQHDPVLWWQHVRESRATPVGRLIEGFEVIADRPIPYNGLPARARSYYSADFATWSDLAEETIDTLLARPKGGEATVRAILLGAREAVTRGRSAAEPGGAVDAVTATRRLLDQLNARDRTLLSAIGWALRPVDRPTLAARMGVDKATIVRGRPRAEARLRELLADPAHSAVTGHAEDLRRRLGPLTREDTAAHALADLGLDLSGDAGQLLIQLAGPYAQRQDWLQDTTRDGLRTARKTVEAAFTRDGAPTVTALLDGLSSLGIPEVTALDVIAHHGGITQFGDKWVRWGPLLADRIEAALHLAGEPLTAEGIVAILGEPGGEQVVREALSRGVRFTRVTRRTWGLRSWGLDEYSGIYDEIVARVDLVGGSVGTRALIEELTTTFPDVAETSFRAYLRAPGLVSDGQVTRRHTGDDGWPPVGPMNIARGVFPNGDNEIRVAESSRRNNSVSLRRVVWGHQLTVSDPVAGQLVGHQHTRHILPPREQPAEEPFGRCNVAPRLTPARPRRCRPVRPHATGIDAVAVPIPPFSQVTDAH